MLHVFFMETHFLMFKLVLDRQSNKKQLLSSGINLKAALLNFLGTI